MEGARNTTQKHIELLGQQTANFESSGGKMASHQDPYVVHRQVHHRLNKQIMEENNCKHDLIAVQDNFGTFENHIIEVMQQAMMTFNQLVGGQAARDQNIYSDMAMAVQRVPLDFEWVNFAVRNAHMLQDPGAPDRTMDSTPFPNQGHVSTKPLIEGTLSRKSRNKLSMAGFTAGYYVVTPSKFLHEFKDSDNFRNDPTPELSIYLPDAIIGATNGDKFNVKGKDSSKGFGSTFSGNAEIAFQAHSAADAEKWSEIIRNAAGATGPSSPGHISTNGGSSTGPNSPISPVLMDKGRVVSQPPTYTEGAPKGPLAIQTTGASSAHASAVSTPVGPHTPVTAIPFSEKK